MRASMMIGVSILIAVASCRSTANGQTMDSERRNEPTLPKLPSGPRPASPTPRKALLEQTNQVIGSPRPTMKAPSGANLSRSRWELGVQRVDVRCPIETSSQRPECYDVVHENFACVQTTSGGKLLGLSVGLSQTDWIRGVSIFTGVFPTGTDRCVFQTPRWFPGHIAHPSVMNLGWRFPIRGIQHVGSAPGATGSSTRSANVVQKQNELTEALLAMTQSRFKNAIGILDQLTRLSPTDANLLRFSAVARMSDGDTAAGARMMARAYAMNISLCDTAMRARDMGLEASAWRALVRQSVSKGHADDEAEMWFLAATLMQAEGRAEPARRMLERAEAAGFDGGIVSRMKAAL